MAKEATYSVSCSYTTTTIPVEVLAATSVTQDVAGGAFQKATQSIPTTAGGTAISLGSLTGALGLYVIKNLDATNYVELMSATSGTKLAKIPPGGACLGYFPSTITAPAALANVGACVIEYLFLPA